MMSEHTQVTGEETRVTHPHQLCTTLEEEQVAQMLPQIQGQIHSLQNQVCQMVANLTNHSTDQNCQHDGSF